MERPSIVQEIVVLFSWGTTRVKMGASGLYLAIRLAVRPLLAYTTISPACSSKRDRFRSGCEACTWQSGWLCERCWHKPLSVLPAGSSGDKLSSTGDVGRMRAGPGPDMGLQGAT